MYKFGSAPTAKSLLSGLPVNRLTRKENNVKTLSKPLKTGLSTQATKQVIINHFLAFDFEQLFNSNGWRNVLYLIVSYLFESDWFFGRFIFLLI